jgi:zinc/manganese transport system substrate-binding protein/zinc transport system substrate-binding protein
MKRLLLTGVLLLGIGLGAAGGTVVSTHAVLGEFAEVVGGPEMTVITIIPSGFCPAQYDLSPSDLAAVLEASVVLYSGIEPWMDTLLDAVDAEAVAVQLMGTWNTPQAAIEKVRAIRDLFVERFPASAEGFHARAEAYIVELEALGSELQAQAEDSGTAGVPVICMQWQSAFVSWLGFDIVATYGTADSLSLRDLVDLTAAGRAADAQLVIDNLQSGVDFGAKLAREVGAVHVVLSNFPGAMPFTATVVDLLRRNATSLFSAIEPIEPEG